MEKTITLSQINKIPEENFAENKCFGPNLHKITTFENFKETFLESDNFFQYFNIKQNLHIGMKKEEGISEPNKESFGFLLKLQKKYFF